jgi:carboxymethylenebutenolidase
MTEHITINETPVYVSRPEGNIKGGLIVIHEVWGLNDHIRNVADRYAAEGYLVYAPDLLSHTGIEESTTAQLQKDLFDPEKRNEVQPKLRELMAPIQSPDFAKQTVESLKQIFDQLYNQPDVKQKVAVLGFCFGGTYSYNLAVAEPRLLAAVPYYGHADQPVEELKNIQAPIQAFYGEKDEGLISKLPDLENRMHEAGVDFSYQVYSNCGHAFFNDTNPYAYNEEAAKDSWQRTQEFLNANFSR